ncbi:MAG: sigma factor [Bacteroidota bacterium]
MFISKRKVQLKQPDVSTSAGFTVIYKFHLKYVYSICYRYLNDHIESEDISAKIFSSIWEKRDKIDQESLQGEGAWKAYLAKAAKLKIYDYLRDQKRAEQHTAEAARELQAFDDITIIPCLTTS